MKFRKKCEHCGATVTAYTLPLNEGLVRAFIMFADARARLRRPLKKGEIGLENSQYSNFQNLRHFGLIYQAEKGRSWEMTPLGWSFFVCKSLILSPAAHMGGVTLGTTHEAWATHPEPRTWTSIRDVLPEEYKQRAEFQAEKTGVA